MKNTRKFTKRRKVKKLIRRMERVNKLRRLGLAFLILGILSVLLSGGDATFFVFAVILAVAAFTEDKDIWEEESD